MATVDQPSIYDVLDVPDPNPPGRQGVTSGTAGNLIARGICSAACMTGPKAATVCTCPCGGRFHGTLTNMHVQAHE